MNKIKEIFSKKNVVIGVLVGLLVIQFVQIQAISYKTSASFDRESSMIQEIGEIREQNMVFGSDMNEIRQFLNLPTKNYLGNEEETSQVEDKNTDQVQLALFKYMESMASQAKKEKNIAKYSSFFTNVAADESLKADLSDMGVALMALEDSEAAIKISVQEEGATLVSYAFDKELGGVKRNTFFESEKIEIAGSAELAKEIRNFTGSNKAKLSGQIQKYWNKVDNTKEMLAAENLTALMTERSLKLGEPHNSNQKTTFEFKNRNEEKVGELIIDNKTLKITLTDSDADTKQVETLNEEVLSTFVKSLNNLTYIEKKVADAKKSVEKTINDKGFKLILSQADITISPTPREDDSRYYYDLKVAVPGGEAKHISSIVIEKSTGVINITQPDGTNGQNLMFFDPEVKKKTLEIPENLGNLSAPVNSDGTFNVLIGGKHGSLIDTMIFAHIDEKERNVKMISIPRDLFYNGRKINAYSHFYGLPELKKVLGNLTGYELDKYIVIDMYAFIDVIDLIGGVDIHLDKAVVDPYYRTVDNGVEGTLHYEPGDYHLGGKEALRLARSRKTSSDFARAERQQLIIEAIQAKARNFGFGDAKVLYEIAKTVLAKTETDISIDEALSYYFKYQNFDVVSTNVMSSGNVLYVPPYTAPGQCKALADQAAAEGSAPPSCLNENQAYTLLPRNNNWNLVKWFFRNEFDPEK